MVRISKIMEIPLVDLKAQYRLIKREIRDAVNNVIDKGTFILGDYVKKFEEEFAEFCNVKYCIGVGNGTDALHFALLACGIKEGDEVITTPHTFIATCEAVTMTGAKIVFADIDINTFNIDPKEIEKRINKKTKAILVVHLYGCPCDMDYILQLSKRYNLRLIEDACQSHGAEYKNRRVGSFGNAAAFSFFPGKNLGAFGDGGAVVTSNKEISAKVRMLRNHGRISKYEHEIEGFNSRLDALQAAILRIKLKYLNEWNEKRRHIARRYDSFLKGIDEVTTPYIPKEAKSIYHLYVIKAKNRDKLQQYLNENGIATGIHYPIPLHLQKAYNYVKLPKGSYPIAEEVSSCILSLPMYPELSERQIHYICDSIKSFYSKI